MNGRVWTPERAVAQVPDHGVQHSRMYLRRSPYADHQGFIDAIRPLLPQTPIPGHEDAMSFVNFLGDIAYRTDACNRIILAVIEATVVIKPKTCITALKEGIRLANPENQLMERVIPVVVVDEERSHTEYDENFRKNPGGPDQVYEQAKAMGAITVKVTPQTLRLRVQKVVQDILLGIVPKT